jgi:glycosyltransferase involved in cell wall biosynthesis
LNSWTFGGVEEHVALLSAQLPALGFEPLVVCSQVEALRRLHQRLDTLGVRWRPFEAQAGARGRLSSTLRLARLLADEGADLLHLQLVYTEGGRFPLVAARLLGLPVVVTNHAAPREAIDPLSRYSRAPLLSTVARFIAVSGANRDGQIRYMGLDPERVTTIRNGVIVPPELPDRAEAHASLCAALGLAPDAKLVGAVGRLCEQKGFDALVDAAVDVIRAVPQTHVVFVGDGHLREVLEAQAVRLGIRANLHFLGFRMDTAALLPAFDVLAMPSVFEGLPLALLEAAAAGCPAVAHAVDGIPEVVEDGVNGFLVPPGDRARLAECISRILQDRELSSRMSAAARRKAVTQFTDERMARETASVYGQLLG